MFDTAREREPVADPWAELPGTTGPQAGQEEGLGRYMLLRQLGRGGMGVVLAAYDPSLDRKVAIKILREGIRGASEGAARMQREAQAMARLSHPNVAQVYEVGEAQGRLYLVMEYVEGQTLGAWLGERPRTLAEVLRVFVEAGRGLAAAHAAGLIHRDFKPDNAMIGADGRVRVLDFGLSRSVLAPADAGAPQASSSNPQLTITAAGSLIGTPAYMSPEQHMRREADARSDQFSFCVALYEALYGARPFLGNDLRELGIRVAAGAIAEPPAHTRVPGWLRQVLVRGLKPDPAARWPDMDALLAALDRDPQRTRRRLLVAGLAVVAVAAASYAAAAYQVAQAQMCSGAAEELRGVWDPSRRAALEQAVRATGVAHAGPLLASVTGRLDAHAAQWVAAHTTACEAHRRGHASAQLFERKMACLRQRRTELGATVDVLTQTTTDSVAHLVEAAVLPPIASCEDDTRLLADVPLPADPELATAVEAMRARLARLQALERAGRHVEALAELEPQLEAMQRLGDVALLAEGHVLAGKLGVHRMLGSEARADLDRGLQLALEAKVDAIAAEALALEIFQIGYIEQRPREALNLAPLAWGLVRRVGAPVQLAAMLHNNVGIVHQTLGDQERGIASLEQGLALFDRSADDPLRWVLVYNLAKALVDVGEFERALELAEPALARLEPIHGSCHFVVASLRAIRAAGSRAAARFAAALADYEQTVECFRVAYPAQAVMSLKEQAATAALYDDAAAREYVGRADAIAAAVPEARPYLIELVLPRVDLDLRAGDHASARGHLEAEQARLLASQGALNPTLGSIETRLALLDHHAGDDAAALARLERAATLLARYWPDEQGLWAFVKAQVLHALGRESSQVAAHVEQAVAEYRRAGAAYARRIAEIEAWAARLPRARH